MKSLKNLACLVLLGEAAAWAQPAETTAAGAWAPAVFDVDRYRHVWTSSPFVVATELTPVSPGLGERYLLTGYAQFDNKFTAFLFDRNSMSRITVRTGEETAGVKLVSINGPDDVKTAVAIIESEGQVGNIRHGQPTDDGGVAAADPNIPRSPGMPPPPAMASAAPNQPGRNTVRPRRVIIRQAPVSLNR